MKFLRIFVFAAIALNFCGAAQAYIGPGLGTGFLGSILGLFLGLLMLMVAIVWYPIKRVAVALGLMKARRPLSEKSLT
jgi:hypothetical protein